MSGRVLVTGATGLIGSRCIAPLRERGFDVIGVSRKECDLLAAGAAAALVAEVRPTHILHLAWCTGIPGYKDSPENRAWLAASLDLLDAAGRLPHCRIVAAGTCLDRPRGAPTTFAAESTAYTTAKSELRRAFDALPKGTLSWVWARVFFLYGPGEADFRLVPFLIRTLRSGQVASCGPGELVRDFLFVDDVAAAFVALLDSEIEGVADIGTGEPTTIADVAAEVGRQLGRSHLIKMGALPPAAEPPMLLADPIALRDVGWRPQVPLSTGISRCLAASATQTAPPPG